MNESKPWYRSKTLVFNLFAAMLVALESVTGLLQPHLPVNFYTVIAVGLPIVNAALRVVTTQALAFK